MAGGDEQRTRWSRGFRKRNTLVMTTTPIYITSGVIDNILYYNKNNGRKKSNNIRIQLTITIYYYDFIWTARNDQRSDINRY